MARLLKQHDDGWYSTDTTIEEGPERIREALNDTRWQILSMIADQPMYPAQIADKMGEKQQNIYYHINKLKDAGLVSPSYRNERGGAVATFYEPTERCLSLMLPGTTMSHEKRPQYDQDVAGFLDPFVQNGEINCKIVVGSPDPHGPHQVRGRDGHLALDLSAFLGGYGEINSRINSLDTEVQGKDAVSSNWILVGGPLTNTATAAINDHLTVRFDQEQFPYRNITSDQSGDTYSDDDIGLITRMRNPDDPEHHVMVIAGIRNRATRAAILSLTRFSDTLLDGYSGEENWSAVVKGKDMSGDGTIDAIDVLE